jgi:hypothetical protein
MPLKPLTLSHDIIHTGLISRTIKSIESSQATPASLAAPATPATRATPASQAASAPPRLAACVTSQPQEQPRRSLEKMPPADQRNIQRSAVRWLVVRDSERAQR